ncbi:MAG: transcriptional repressor [Burkholderiales bacterium]|nr:transcriptional repressor [Burkholderiales bacterium]
MQGIKELLNKKGHKATPARLAIINIFKNNKKPISAEEVYKNLKTKLKNINVTTIYRNLSSLSSEGILRKVDLKKDFDLFELNEDHHHHIVCTDCNKIESFKNKEVENLLNTIIKKSNNFKQIKEHSFEIFGLCKACSK